MMLSEFKNLRNLDVTSLKVSSLETSSVRYIGDSCFCFRSIYKLIHCFFYGDIYSRDLAPKMLGCTLGDWAFTDRKWGYQKTRLGMYETIEEYSLALYSPTKMERWLATQLVWWLRLLADPPDTHETEYKPSTFPYWRIFYKGFW